MPLKLCFEEKNPQIWQNLHLSDPLNNCWRGEYQNQCGYMLSFSYVLDDFQSPPPYKLKYENTKLNVQWQCMYAYVEGSI